MNQEKAVNHGVHCEHSGKKKTYISLTNRSTGEMQKSQQPSVFAVPAVSPWLN